MNTIKRQGVSVLVPIYNESRSLHTTLYALHTVLVGLNNPFEIIAIDDGSTDGTCTLLQTLDLPGLVVLSHPGNYGYGASLTNGLRHARYTNIVITDADGTYPIEQIPHLLAALDEYTMAIGARSGRHAAGSCARRAAKWALRQLAQMLTGATIADLNSGLRAIRREALEALIPILPNRFSWTSTVTVGLHMLKQPVVYMPIAYYERTGSSKFHPVCDTLRAVQCILRAFLWGRRHQRLLVKAVEV